MMNYSIAISTIILSSLALCCASSETHDATTLSQQGVRKAAISIHVEYVPKEETTFQQGLLQKERIQVDEVNIPKGWPQQRKNAPILGDKREKKSKDRIINVSENSTPNYVPSDRPSMIPSLIPIGRPLSQSAIVVDKLESGNENMEPFVEDIAITMPSDMPSTMPSDMPLAIRLNQIEPAGMDDIEPLVEDTANTMPSDRPSMVPSYTPTFVIRQNQMPNSFPSMAPSIATPSDFPSVQPIVMSVSSAGSSIPSSLTSAIPSVAPTFAVRLNQLPHSFPSMAPSITTPSDFPSDQPSLMSVSAAGSSSPSSTTRLASAPKSDSTKPLTYPKEENEGNAQGGHQIEYCSGGTEAFERMASDIRIPYTYNLHMASDTTSAQVDHYVSSIEDKVVEALNQALCYTSGTEDKDEKEEEDEGGESKRGRPRRGYRVSAVGYSSYPRDTVEGACDDVDDRRGGERRNDGGFMCKKVMGAATLRIFQAKETSTITGVDSLRCAASQNIYDLMQYNFWDGFAYTEATTDFTCNAEAIELPNASSTTTPSSSSSNRETVFPLTATTILVASAAAVMASILGILYSRRLHRTESTTTCGEIVQNSSSRDSVGCSTIIANNLSCSRSREEAADLNELDFGSSSTIGLARHSSSASRRIMHTYSDASRRTLQSRNSSNRGWGGVVVGSGSGLSGSSEGNNDRYTPQEQEARQQQHWRTAAAMAAAAAYQDEYDYNVDDDGDYDDIPLSERSDSDIYTTPDRSTAMMSPSTRSDISWMCAALDGGGISPAFGSPRV